VIIRTILFLIAAITGGAVILYNVVKFLNDINKGKSRLYKEINKIRLETQGMHEDLVPIDAGELKNISNNHQVERTKITQSKKNVITSIYNEPFVAYYPKEISGTDKSILVAYTSDKEFSYIVNNGVTDIFIDEQPFARIFKDGAVKDMNGRLMGYVDNNRSKGEKRIILNQKPVAIIKDGMKQTMTEKPLLQIEQLNKEEEELVLALALPELVKR
jgi:phage-related protein